jgi:hypothetical protein
MRYTGLNPSGINQVASGSVSVSVENTRVATFGTNTLQVTGSTVLSGSLTNIGTLSQTNNVTISSGSLRINSGTFGVTAGGNEPKGGIIYFGDDTYVTINRDYAYPNNILKFKILGPNAGGWGGKYIWTVNDGPTEPGFDVMTLTSNVGGASAVLLLTGSMTINGGGITTAGTVTGTRFAASTSTILSNAIFSLTSSIGSPFENAIFKIGTNGGVGWGSKFLFKNNWQGTELDTLTLVGYNGVSAVGINNTSPSFTLDVSGSGRFTNNLSVIGTETVNGSLIVTGSTIVTGSLTAIGPTIFTGSFTVFTGSAIEFQVTDTGTKHGNLSTDTHTITGSTSITGSLNVIGSTTYSNFGITYTTFQISGSTRTAVIPTSSLYTASIATSQSIMLNAMVTGYGTGSRDTITGEIKTTIKRVGGNATLIGTPFRYINADASGSDINVGVSASVFTLSVTGSSAEPYNWFATITTQTV